MNITPPGPSYAKQMPRDTYNDLHPAGYSVTSTALSVPPMLPWCGAHQRSTNHMLSRSATRGFNLILLAGNTTPLPSSIAHMQIRPRSPETHLKSGPWWYTAKLPRQETGCSRRTVREDPVFTGTVKSMFIAACLWPSTACGLDTGNPTPDVH